MRRGDHVIELANAAAPPDATVGSIPAVTMRKQRALPAEAAVQAPKKFCFVDEILRTMNRVHGSRKINRWRNRAHRTDFRRRRIAPLARAFQNEIATHRVSGKRDARQLSLANEFRADGGHVAGEP